jgi:hypothetical protein
MFVIESGVECPKDRFLFPFREMSPGDSFLLDTQNRANSARISAKRFVAAHAPDWEFRLRKVENGWRLWRIA